jgi:O-methyltransferase involved in polyketide biosynthesis
LLGQITHYLTPAQNLDLFRRIHAALKPGGTLLLDVPMTGAQPSEWTAITSLLLWVNAGGGTHSFEQYHLWLKETGFAQVRQVSERRAAAVKAGEIADDISSPP